MNQIPFRYISSFFATISGGRENGKRKKEQTSNKKLFIMVTKCQKHLKLWIYIGKKWKWQGENVLKRSYALM